MFGPVPAQIMARGRSVGGIGDKLQHHPVARAKRVGTTGLLSMRAIPFCTPFILRYVLPKM